MFKEDHVMITVPHNSNTMRIETVGHRYSPFSALYRTLGGRKAKTRWDFKEDKGYVLVSLSNYQDTLDTLRAIYDTVTVVKWHSTNMECNASCQNAKGDWCVCKCLHAKHGVKDKRYVMVNPVTEKLVLTDWQKVEITYTRNPEEEAELTIRLNELLASRETVVENEEDDDVHEDSV